MRNHFLWLFAALALPVSGAELTLDFGQVATDQAPPGFRSAVSGEGKPGQWKVLLDDVPSLMPALRPGATATAQRAVLAQVAQDPTDEHFPLLIYENETFGDFTLTTRFKTVRGKAEQMAGIAFRVQNETNYYVVRASSLGNTFRFYKVINGQRGPLVGPELPIPSGVWHELTVESKGINIRCLLDGKELISVADKVNPLSGGKIAFWTKSDSVSYFWDTKIVYAPFVAPAQRMVQDLLKTYPRLLGLKVYVLGSDPKTTRLIASRDEGELGQAGGKPELDVISSGAIYYGKAKESVSVTLPLRDRNGDNIAAVKVVMKTFAGQTEQNAVARATPIVKALQARIQSLDELVQ